MAHQFIILCFYALIRALASESSSRNKRDNVQNEWEAYTRQANEKRRDIVRKLAENSAHMTIANGTLRIYVEAQEDEKERISSYLRMEQNNNSEEIMRMRNRLEQLNQERRDRRLEHLEATGKLQIDQNVLRAEWSSLNDSEARMESHFARRLNHAQEDIRFARKLALTSLTLAMFGRGQGPSDSGPFLVGTEPTSPGTQIATNVLDNIINKAMFSVDGRTAEAVMQIMV